MVNGAVARRAQGARRGLSALTMVVLVAGGAASARAEDGVLGFFQQVFGGGGARPSYQPLPQPGEGFESGSPPLTVHKRNHRRPSGAQVSRTERYSPEELRLITIYTDKTLMRGDAVMTARGLRIFNGSASWPYTDNDFVAISSSQKIPKNLRKELTAIDVASRSDVRGY